MRTQHDAILVGVGTIMADDPELTVRLVDGPDPLRVILDSRLRTSMEARIFGRTPDRVLVFTSELAPQASIDRCRAVGADVVAVPATHDGVSLDGVLDALAERRVSTLLVEGGPQVITSFLRAHLADHIVCFVAPKIVGRGMEAIGDLGITTMDAAIRLEDATLHASGEDWIMRGRPVWPTGD